MYIALLEGWDGDERTVARRDTVREDAALVLNTPSLVAVQKSSDTAHPKSKTLLTEKQVGILYFSGIAFEEGAGWLSSGLRPARMHVKKGIH